MFDTLLILTSVILVLVLLIYTIGRISQEDFVFHYKKSNYEEDYLDECPRPRMES